MEQDKNKYSTGKIYALRSHQTEEVYIGSTIEKLCIRKGKHMAKFKAHLLGKMYKNDHMGIYTSYKLCKYDDMYIELIEDCPCDTKEQLNRREGEIIRSTPHAVNKRIEGRTRQEYKEDMKKIIE